MSITKDLFSWQLVVSLTTYALLSNLFLQALLTTKTLVEIILVLNSHFDQALSVLVERYKFNSHVQQAGESVANFIAEFGETLQLWNIVIQNAAWSNPVWHPRWRNPKEIPSWKPLTLKRATQIARQQEMQCK